MSCNLPYNFKEISPMGGGERSQETFNLENLSIEAVRYFRGPWKDRLKFIYEYLIPQPTVLTPNGTIRRKTHTYPYMKGLSVSSISCNAEGVGVWDSDEERTDWERCIITVTYSKKVSNQKDTNDKEENDFKDWIYYDEQINSSLESLEWDGRDVVDAAGVKKHEKGKFKKLIVNATIIIIQKAVLRPNWRSLGRMLGKINNRVFITPSGFVCPIGTVRYDGPDTSTKVNVFDGSGLLDDEAFPLPVFEISHKFEFNRIGWNFKPKPGGGVEEIKFADGKPFYESGDMYSIFFGSSRDAKTNELLEQIQDSIQAIDVLDILLSGDPLNPDLLRNDIEKELTTIDTLKRKLGFRL